MVDRRTERGICSPSVQAFSWSYLVLRWGIWLGYLPPSEFESGPAKQWH